MIYSEVQSDLLLIALLLDDYRYEELRLISWFFKLCMLSNSQLFDSNDKLREKFAV